MNNLNWKLVNSVATNYTYDQIDQLLTENGGSIQGSFYVNDQYSYDANGNRATKLSASHFVGGVSIGVALAKTICEAAICQ